MPGSPVTLGCSVIVSPGVAGPPDSGVVAVIQQAHLSAAGLPLATTGSLCQMVNAISGAPYVLPIGSLGLSGVLVGGQKLVRVGDQIPSGAGVLTVIGPPAAPFVTDSTG